MLNWVLHMFYTQKIYFYLSKYLVWVQNSWNWLCHPAPAYISPPFPAKFFFTCIGKGESLCPLCLRSYWFKPWPLSLGLCVVGAFSLSHTHTHMCTHTDTSLQTPWRQQYALFVLYPITHHSQSDYIEAYYLIKHKRRIDVYWDPCPTPSYHHYLSFPTKDSFWLWLG